MSETRATVIAEVIRVVLTRRMTYAYQGIGEIILDISVGLDRLELEIAVKGLPYWIDLEQELKQYPKGADQYRLKKLGWEGQRFSMCFYLDPGIDILSFQKQDNVEETLLDDALKVRRASAEDSDINEVMRCIYSNYSYEYPNPVIYESAQMKSLLSEGRQWSYLGCNDHGQVLAHAALSFHGEFPGVPEVSALVCKPFCRGNNVMGRIVEGVCRNAEEEGNGLFAIPVAFHPYSQKIFTGITSHPRGCWCIMCPPSGWGLTETGTGGWTPSCVCQGLSAAGRAPSERPGGAPGHGGSDL